ncbi:MAG: PD40 domain-containing protein [Abitibacteriaceae bacterium]|nr:PD40 domain-containing protein [Abditibacteriaceae bacterium]MBV9865804.1 PD40 domain-containing protein [Abditibacteriaceae bacterium]
MKLFSRIQFICLLVVCTGAARARGEGDIVYAARYYLKPGQRGQSHAHLYRINPDGTGRRQLTRGQKDEVHPLWSPDGQQIAFMRYSCCDNSDALCLIGANGGIVKPVACPYPQEYGWVPHSHTLAVLTDKDLLLIDAHKGAKRSWGRASAVAWSPDGKRCLMTQEKGDGQIRAYPDGRVLGTVHELFDASWLDNATLVGLGAEESNTMLKVVGADGHEQRRVTLKPKDADSKEALEGAAMQVLRMPNDIHAVLVASYGVIAARTYTYFKVPLDGPLTGTMQRFFTGKVLHWSPDGQRFCTYPYWDLAPFDKKKDGSTRVVYVAPLQIGASRTGTLHSIVSGLVFVTDCDWRKPD